MTVSLAIRDRQTLCRSSQAAMAHHQRNSDSSRLFQEMGIAHSRSWCVVSSKQTEVYEQTYHCAPRRVYSSSTRSRMTP